MPSTPRYPTQAHERAAAAIVEFFADRDETDAVLLVNSRARGKAAPDSCLDIKVLVPEGADPAALDEAWRRHHDADPVFAALREVGRFAVLHLDLEDERFDPISPPEDEYPDPSEIAIGNFLVYSVPLWERGDRLARLRRRWLPYYDEALRQERLTAARQRCQHHLDPIPSYVDRGLHFAAFDRLYTAFQCFLQSLVIARRTHPIAYNKWIREQIVNILGLPELYARLPPLFELERLESTELVDKVAALRALADAYAVG